MAEMTTRTLRSVKPVQPVRAPEPPKKKTFWIVYGAVVALLLIVLAVALAVLTAFLSAYEASQPVHAAQDLFDECFAGGDFSRAYEKSGFAPGPFEDVSAVDAALKRWGEGKDLVFYPVKAEPDRARYNVIYADPVQEETATEEEGAVSHRDVSLKIATMVFRRSEKDLGFGFKGWEFDKLEMDLAGRESVTVTAPAGAVLTVNGKVVPDEMIVSSEESPYNAFLPEGVTGITWTEYRVEGLFAAPEVKCADKDGRDMALEADGSGKLTARLNYRQDLEAELSDFVRKGMEAYACFIQADGPIGNVAKYFDTSSLFYRNTARNPGVWVIDHNGYHFENETVTDFYAYNDEIVSCRVDMTQVLTKSRSEDYRDHMRMTVFLHKVKGAWRIFDRMSEN
ncbi:MAG: hypothetical protein II776_03280 [Clostridia bacterium]|nr:hypothetical protein [Clostridia bacterium]